MKRYKYINRGYQVQNTKYTIFLATIPVCMKHTIFYYTLQFLRTLQMIFQWFEQTRIGMVSKRLHKNIICMSCSFKENILNSLLFINGFTFKFIRRIVHLSI